MNHQVAGNPFIMFPPAAGGGFAIQNISTVSVNRNVDSPTISVDVATGAVILVICIGFVDATISSVVDTSDSDTVLLGHSVTGSAIYYIVNPTVNASKTITVNMSGSGVADTIINAATFTGDFDSGTLGDTGDHNNSGVNNVSTSGTNAMVAAGSDSLIIANFFQSDNNSAVGSSTFGTDQVIIADGANGGAEKFYGCATYEIITASGANDQSITMSKSGANIVAAIEFRLG